MLGSELPDDEPVAALEGVELDEEPVEPDDEDEEPVEPDEEPLEAATTVTVPCMNGWMLQW